MAVAVRSQTTYAIVYGTSSGMIRRVISDDDGMVSAGTMPDGVTPAVVCSHRNGQPSYHPIASGESVLVDVPPSAISSANPARWVSALQKVIGFAPPIITCAVIDRTNKVILIIQADPAIDAAPDGTMMVQCYSPQIAVGHTYDPTTGLFTAPSATIAPGLPGNVGGPGPKEIPATVIPRP